jgi:hypothetical protein
LPRWLVRCVASQLGASPLPASLQVQARRELPPGCEQELEIRAATVVAVERLRAALQARCERGQLALPAGGRLLSIYLDWLLWEIGEEARQRHPPHHRTLTCYY